MIANDEKQRMATHMQEELAKFKLLLPAWHRKTSYLIDAIERAWAHGFACGGEYEAGSDPEKTRIADLEQEVDYLRSEKADYDRLQRKVNHGCADFNCALCDKG